jgi:ubiquinone/menaquinone biosynthesis C-methylase UbiE
VITIHVLEHLTNPIKALLEWNRVVKVEKNSLLFKERFEELKKGHYPSWASIK